MSQVEFTTNPRPRTNISVGRKKEDTTKTITRADLADAIYRKIGLPRAEATKYVEMVLEEIFERIVAREDVKLSSFGAFIVRAKKERVGRNPKTGANARISARLVVSFKPSNILRARINGVDAADDDANY